MAGLTNRIKNFESIIFNSDPQGTFEYVFILSNSKVENDSGLRAEGGHHHIQTDLEVGAPDSQFVEYFIGQDGSGYTWV